ncbi:hypothetical protein RLIN73S_02131 [Rhodanobacter lindaniclasticus]
MLLADHLDGRRLRRTSGIEHGLVANVACSGVCKPLAASLSAAGVQAALHGVGIGTSASSSGAVFQHRREHRGVEAMRQSGDLVQCSLIAAQQLLQRLAGDRRRVRVVGQRGIPTALEIR